MYAPTKLEEVPNDKLYIAVRCFDGAGLSTTVSSDGLKILNRSLSVDKTFIEVMTKTKTQYTPTGKYHGDPNEVKFRWTGFKEDEGINN